MVDHHHTRISLVLDISRWVSAFLVVFGHVMMLVFDAKDPQLRAHWWSESLMIIAGSNHAAVMVFFVLSGYLVGGGVFRAVAAGEFSWRMYLINRISRLYAVLVVALILGGLLDLCGWQWFNVGGLYDGGEKSPWSSYSIIDNLDWRTFLINLISCQRILGEQFGSNGPLWSLANEFWYYLMCPFLAALLFGGNGLRRFLSGLALLGMLAFVGQQISFFFLIWLLGAALPVLSWRQIPVWGWWFAALIVYIVLEQVGVIDGITRHFPIGRIRGLLADSGVAVLFGGLLVAVQNNDGQAPVNGTGIHRHLADFSYSLYLTHFPLLLLACAACQTWFGFGFQNPLNPWLLLVVVGLVMLSYGYSYGVAWCTEFRTTSLRARMKAWLLPNQLDKRDGR